MPREEDTLGKRIRAVLTQKGISQRQLEKRAGLSQGYVTRLIHGERDDMRTETLHAIADVDRKSVV